MSDDLVYDAGHRQMVNGGLLTSKIISSSNEEDQRVGHRMERVYCLQICKGAFSSKYYVRIDLRPEDPTKEVMDVS